MGMSWEQFTPSEMLSDLCILDTHDSLWRRGQFSFLYLFLVSWSWQGKVLSLRYPLQRQLARSSKKTTYLHAYLHKPVWTLWPVAFPSSSRGIKKKFQILSLRINHKLQNADFKFFSPQIHLQLFSGCMIFFLCFLWVFLDVCFSSFCSCSVFSPALFSHASRSCFRKWI